MTDIWDEFKEIRRAALMDHEAKLLREREERERRKDALQEAARQTFETFKEKLTKKIRESPTYVSYTVNVDLPPRIEHPQTDLDFFFTSLKQVLEQAFGEMIGVKLSPCMDGFKTYELEITVRIPL